MPQYLIEATTRFLVIHAETAERALAWFEDEADIDVDVSPIAYGPRVVVGTVSDNLAPVQLLEPGEYEAWAVENVVRTIVHTSSPLQRWAERFRAATWPLSCESLRGHGERMRSAVTAVVGG